MKPLALALAGLLVLSACGGESKDGAASPDTSSAAEASPGPTAIEPGLSPKSGGPLAEPSESGKPAPTPQPKQVKSLVGTWQGSSPVKDYFVFTAAGAGKLMAQGKELWSGTVIPAGKNTFRLSWQGTDPGASYWQVQVNQAGTELTFAANGQVYKKVAKPVTSKTTKPAA